LYERGITVVYTGYRIDNLGFYTPQEACEPSVCSGLPWGEHMCRVPYLSAICQTCFISPLIFALVRIYAYMVRDARTFLSRGGSAGNHQCFHMILHKLVLVQASLPLEWRVGSYVLPIQVLLEIKDTHRPRVPR